MVFFFRKPPEDSKWIIYLICLLPFLHVLNLKCLNAFGLSSLAVLKNINWNSLIIYNWTDEASLFSIFELSASSSENLLTFFSYMLASSPCWGLEILLNINCLCNNHKQVARQGRSFFFLLLRKMVKLKFFWVHFLGQVLSANKFPS